MLADSLVKARVIQAQTTISIFQVRTSSGFISETHVKLWYNGDLNILPVEGAIQGLPCVKNHLSQSESQSTRSVSAGWIEVRNSTDMAVDQNLFHVKLSVETVALFLYLRSLTSSF